MLCYLGGVCVVLILGGVCVVLLVCDLDATLYLKLKQI